MDTPVFTERGKIGCTAPYRAGDLGLKSIALTVAQMIEKLNGLVDPKTLVIDIQVNEAALPGDPDRRISVYGYTRYEDYKAHLAKRGVKLP